MQFRTSSDADSVAKMVPRLVRDVQAILDNRLWPPVVLRFVGQVSPDLLVEAIRALISDGHLTGYRRTYMAVIQCLLSGRAVDYERARDIYLAAAAAECDPIQMLLLRAPALRRAGRYDVQPDHVTRDIPLGRRKSMARSHDRDVLTRLLMDPTRSVVKILLGNSHIVEEDVVRIAARRPNLPDVFEEISEHPKWVLRYNVQEALVRNPYTPTSLSAAFVPLLTSRHVRELAFDGGLHEAVRQAARTVISWRTGKPWDGPIVESANPQPVVKPVRAKPVEVVVRIDPAEVEDYPLIFEDE